MPEGRRDDRHNRRRRRPAKRRPLQPPHITVTDTDAEEDGHEPARVDQAGDVQDVYRARHAPIDELADESWTDSAAAEPASWRDSEPEPEDERERRASERESGGERRDSERESGGEEEGTRTRLTEEEEMLLQTAVPYGARSNTPNEWGFGHSRAASRAESADEEIPEELEGRSRSRSRYKNVAPRVDTRRNSVSVSHTSSLQDLSQRQEVPRRDTTRHVSLDLSPRPRSEERAAPTRSRSRSRSRSVSRLAMKKEDTGYETDYDQVGSRFAEAGEKWRAKRVTIYKNADPWFQGWDMRFVPYRDKMDNIYSRISERFGSLPGSDLSSGIRYIFTTDGTRVNNIDELVDGSSYVASPTSKFQKAPYGMKRAQPESGDISPRKPRRHRVKPLSPVVKRVFGKHGSSPGPGSGSGSGSGSGKHGGRRSGDGCKIKIINNQDKSIQSYVLVNLKTTQRFEDVLQDLGQVIKMKDAQKMYTTWGQESSRSRVKWMRVLFKYMGFKEPVSGCGRCVRDVRDGPMYFNRTRIHFKRLRNRVKSFSQLRNDFYETDTFYLANGDETTVRGSKVTREETRKPVTDDKKSGKVLRRHNSEPLIQVVKEKKSGVGRKRADSVAGTKGSAVGGGGGGLSAGDQVKVSLLGRVRTFYKPAKDTPVQYLPPEKRLKLAWVHGYRGVDAHHNLWVLPSGELLYYVAAVAVLLNRHTDTQRHYAEHSEDIMCMDLHPSRHIVASGQRAGVGARTASVRVWGVERLDTLHVFGSRELQVGVAAVSFSVLNQGAYLLAIDAGDEHLLTVWTWHNEQILGKVATHQDHVYGAKFHPMDNNLIITYGKHHLTFWNKRRDGIFDAVDVFGSSSARTVLSVEFEPGGDLITGDSDGFITTWSINNDGQYYKRVDFEAHTSAVTSLLMLSEVTLMSGGERDRRICAWDCSQDYIKRAETKLPEAAGGVRTLCPQRSGASDGNVYAGTVKNMILEGSIMRRFNTVVFGHSKHLWALSACHDDDCFVTAGYDRLVVKWSDTRKVVWKAPLNSEAVSCAVHPLDTVVAVGAIDGHLTVYKMTDGTQVGSFRVCGQPLSCLSFSPGGDMLAVGAQTGSIYPYKVGRDGLVYVKFGPMQGSQPLTQLDWSTDGEYLQAVTVDHELILWSKRTLAKEKFQHTLRDKNWATYTCTVGYPVLGAWPELHYDRQTTVWTDSYADSRKARVLVTACRSRDHDLLAVGDSEGSVQLYRYPCPLNVQESAQCHSTKPQSSYVANVRFLRSGRQLVSVGGTDATLLQWRLQ